MFSYLSGNLTAIHQRERGTGACVPRDVRTDALHAAGSRFLLATDKTTSFTNARTGEITEVKKLSSCGCNATTYLKFETNRADEARNRVIRWTIRCRYLLGCFPSPSDTAPPYMFSLCHSIGGCWKITTSHNQTEKQDMAVCGGKGWSQRSSRSVFDRFFDASRKLTNDIRSIHSSHKRERGRAR